MLIPFLWCSGYQICLVDIKIAYVSGCKLERTGVHHTFLGLRTVPVPHRPDGSVLRVPYPCHSECLSTTLTDGGRDGLGLSKTVQVWPWRPFRRLDGRYLQAFWNFTTSLYSITDIHWLLPSHRRAVHFKYWSMSEPPIYQHHLSLLSPINPLACTSGYSLNPSLGAASLIHHMSVLCATRNHPHPLWPMS